ncbi:hypothetical protein BH23ACT3_BH23ACT3_20340 [soil metagenome]
MVLGREIVVASWGSTGPTHIIDEIIDDISGDITGKASEAT